MRIKILKPTVIDGSIRYEGEIVEIADLLASSLIRRGRACEAKAAAPAKSAAPETAAVEPAAEKAVRPRARKRGGAKK